MKLPRSTGIAVALTGIVCLSSAPAFASGGSATGGKTTDPTTATGGTTSGGKGGGCSPFVAYETSAVGPSMWVASPMILVAMTVTNCSGGGTPVYGLSTTFSDPSGVRPDFVQKGSYCVRGGVTYTVTFGDNLVDPGTTYNVKTVVTASNGQIVDTRTSSVTTPI